MTADIDGTLTLGSLSDVENGINTNTSNISSNDTDICHKRMSSKTHITNNPSTMQLALPIIQIITTTHQILPLNDTDIATPTSI